MLLSLQALPILFGLIPGVCSDNVSPYLYSEEYDKGELGLFPHHEYKSSPFVSPILNYKKYDPICDDGLHIMITPRGEEIHQQGPMILNAKGDLVFYRDYGPTYGLDVHNFKGEDYLTFWAGNDGVTGHGEGNYYLVSGSTPNLYFSPSYIDSSRHHIISNLILILPLNLARFHISRSLQIRCGQRYSWRPS